jgi:hypothetical protein
LLSGWRMFSEKHDSYGLMISSNLCWVPTNRGKQLVNLIVGGAHSVMRARLISLSHVFGLCVLVLWCAGLRAQDKCNAEVKLLLSPNQTQATIKALNLKKEEAGRVYFFDTNALDLLSQGLIIRLRQGANNDLTVKLRPQGERKAFVPHNMGEGFKCEVDLIDGVANPSYTVRINYVAGPVPETGADIQSLLDIGQEKLLKDAQIPVDWTHVKKIADIQATSWQTNNQPNFNRLTLELWEWPGGRVLELSAKVAPDAGSSVYTELKKLVNNKGLLLNNIQQAKTGIVLEMLKPKP